LKYQEGTDSLEEKSCIITTFLAISSAAFTTDSWHSVCAPAETSFRHKRQAVLCCMKMCI